MNRNLVFVGALLGATVGALLAGCLPRHPFPLPPGGRGVHWTWPSHDGDAIAVRCAQTCITAHADAVAGCRTRCGKRMRAAAAYRPAPSAPAVCCEYDTHGCRFTSAVGCPEVRADAATWTVPVTATVFPPLPVVLEPHVNILVKAGGVPPSDRAHATLIVYGPSGRQWVSPRRCLHRDGTALIAIPRRVRREAGLYKAYITVEVDQSAYGMQSDFAVEPMPGVL